MTRVVYWLISTRIFEMVASRSDRAVRSELSSSPIDLRRSSYDLKIVIIISRKHFCSKYRQLTIPGPQALELTTASCS